MSDRNPSVVGTVVGGVAVYAAMIYGAMFFALPFLLGVAIMQAAPPVGIMICAASVWFYVRFVARAGRAGAPRRVIRRKRCSGSGAKGP